MKTSHTEDSILLALRKKYLAGEVTYRIANAYVFQSDWESDFLIQRRSGYCYEFEIKISRADFFADRKKLKKHRIIETGRFEGTEYKFRPNGFYYVVPSGMLASSEVPKYAGLICVNENGSVEEVKRAPLIHKETLDLTKKLCRKFYFYYENTRVELVRAQQTLSELRQRLEAAGEKVYW